MGEQTKNFKAMGAQSTPYEELSDIKRQFAELKKAYQRLYIYTTNLTCKIQLKDQEIDDLYCRMYGLAEMPKRKKDRNKIRRILQMIENRPRNRPNNPYSATDFLYSDILPIINFNRRIPERRSRIDSFDHGGGRYNDSLTAIWHDDQDMRYDEYEWD